MLAAGISQGHTMRPLLGATSRQAVIARGRDKWAVALYEHGSLVVALAHHDREWIYEQAEAWLARYDTPH